MAVSSCGHESAYLRNWDAAGTQAGQTCGQMVFSPRRSVNCEPIGRVRGTHSAVGEGKIGKQSLPGGCICCRILVKG